MGSSQYQTVRTSSPDVAATSYYDNYKSESSKKYLPSYVPHCRPAAPMKGKGMQLGKKTNTRLYDALSSEIATVDESPVASSPASSAPETHHSSASEGIQVSLTETTTAKTHRDGGLETMEVQGLLNLHISDSTISRVQLDMHTSEADGTQFKTHPNVDRQMFKDQHKIGFRNSAKGFPLNQQMCVLRWRLQAKVDSTTLPISGWFPIQCS
jgi:hypothetical protein